MLALLLLLCVTTAVAQGLSATMQKQRKLFPQEKVYVMTDRDTSISLATQHE